VSRALDPDVDPRALETQPECRSPRIWSKSRVLSFLDRCAVLRGMSRAESALLVGLLTFAWLGLRSSLAQSPKEKSKEQDAILIKPEKVQGCYELGTLEWRPDLKLGKDAVFITPPPRIQILVEGGTSGFEKNEYLVRPAPGLQPSIHSSTYWVPKGPNSIELIFTTGFSGLSIYFKLEGDTLQGTAQTFWDFDRKQQTAHVVAHKIDCLPKK